MPDKELKCIECGDNFIFPESMEKKLLELEKAGKIDKFNEPKRCPACRAAKKQRHRSQGA